MPCHNHHDDYADPAAARAPDMTTTENGTRTGHADPWPAMTLGRVEHGNGDSRRPLKTSERVALDIVHDIVASGSRTGDHLPLEAQMVERVPRQPGVGPRGAAAPRGPGPHLPQARPRWRARRREVDPANLARTASLYFHLGGANYDQLLRTQAMLEPFCAQLAAQSPDRRQAMEPFLVAAQPVSAVDYRRHARHFHAADLPARRQPDHLAAHAGHHAHRHRPRRGDDGPHRAAIGDRPRARRAGQGDRRRSGRDRRPPDVRALPRAARATSGNARRERLHDLIEWR